ncbi:MAG TPA: AbrB/MazE/SpoVT family DNA-binding domain-containing protein [Sulfurivirga caldicuralii]|nr:AbrB/MazE/SpoVT family DNA-binding domain-containing protein [Sulfurivirga caldicuralii]
MLTRIFRSGNSQAVRIPKAYRFAPEVTEVEIFKRGNELVIRPKTRSLSELYQILDEMPDDFMASGRPDDLPPQERERF